MKYSWCQRWNCRQLWQSTGLNEIAGTVPFKAQSLFRSCFIETLLSLAKSFVQLVALPLLPNYWPTRNGSILHMLLNVPRCAAHCKGNCIVLQGTSLVATSSYSIRGGKGWPGSKGRLSVPLLFCVHARQDASSRPPLSPLLWLWLPPDVTPLLVTAQTLVADFVVSVYLSQLFSLVVKFMEFHTLLNHYCVSFSWEREYTRSCMHRS